MPEMVPVLVISRTSHQILYIKAEVAFCLRQLGLK